MSLLLEQGDYVPDGTGSIVSVWGGQAVLNEVLFRLTARRGRFPLMPELGSRMHLLREEKASRRTVLARQYAAEALEGLDEVTVTDAVVWTEGDRLCVRVELAGQGETLTVEWEES